MQQKIYIKINKQFPGIIVIKKQSFGSFYLNVNFQN